MTHKNWLAAQFAPMRAVQDFGFDIDPATARETLWWAPGAWVASALQAGVQLPLLSCGPYWLDRLPYRFSGRKVRTMPLCDVPRAVGHCWTDQVFTKLPEEKVENFPARLHGSRYLADNLAEYHLSPDTLVQLQTPVEFVTEARFWVTHGEVTAHSFYRVHDVIHGELIWGSEGFEAFVNCGSTASYQNECLYRMRAPLQDLTENVLLPPGVVVDMGITRSGDVLVVEANAAWSSSPYDADPVGIFLAIEAAHDFAGEHLEWAWRPNTALYKAGPLKIVSRA